ncbi:hypothetical protein DOTSEDRAFT_68461, partial [Dothistroma septosporum NZE10]
MILPPQCTEYGFRLTCQSKPLGTSRRAAGVTSTRCTDAIWHPRTKPRPGYTLATKRPALTASVAQRSRRPTWACKHAWLQNAELSTFERLRLRNSSVVQRSA